MSNAGLSIEEFERLQNQLLELKSNNYQLVEQNNKKDAEIHYLSQKGKTLEDDLQKANTTIARSKRAKDIFTLEQDVELLRHKLAVQEEEFRLQQSTLMSELNRLVSQEKQNGDENHSLQSSVSDNSNVELCRLQAEFVSLQVKFQESEEKLKLLQNEKANLNGTANESNEDPAKISSLEAEIADLKNINANLKINSDENKLLQEKLRQQNEEHRTKLTYFQQQLAELNEKLRKKQESFQMISDEKERQYVEFKKSLDNMIRKKDAEINNLVEEINQTKRTLDKSKEEDEIRMSERASSQSLVDHLKSQLTEAVDQNETFQIQLQESLSANDCLSNQLHEAREDVVRMQQQVTEAVEAANKRKELVEEMAKHLEKLKDVYSLEKANFQKNFDEATSALKKEVETLTSEVEKKSSGFEVLEEEMENLKILIVSKENEIEMLKKQVKNHETNLELIQIQHDEFIVTQKTDYEKILGETNEKFELMKKSYEEKIENLTATNKILTDSLESSRQSLKDKTEEIKVLERKQLSILKDLKKQAQTEKKRADRLQEKLQETITEVVRNKSPGFEEVRATDLNGKSNVSGDARSVSEWSVVSANHQKENDRHSSPGDGDSVSSVTMLESDNQELISSVARLQKRNCELEEKVHILEESSSAMADDLMNKAAVIEQFLKEKPLTVQHSVPPGSPDKIHIGIKKVMDLVKIDQTAGEIRDMNKRLQLMLEETLTKNMHLQRDLELMSREVARLSSMLPAANRCEMRTV